jgi:hypothetical protein
MEFHRKRSRSTRASASGERIENWAAGFKIYGDLRLARLCAFLRHRTPDDEVGYSILIYRLSNEQVQQPSVGLCRNDDLLRANWLSNFNRFYICCERVLSMFAQVLFGPINNL